MKPALPNPKSIENANLLAHLCTKKYSYYPLVDTKTLIDEFTLKRIEKDTNSELQNGGTLSLSAIVCFAYISLLKGEIETALDFFKRAVNMDIKIFSVYFTAMAALGKFSLIEQEISHYSKALQDNLQYDILLSWYMSTGKFSLVKDGLSDIKKKNFKFEHFKAVENKLIKIEALLDQIQTPVEEYQAIIKYMLLLLEAKSIDFRGLALPELDSPVIIMKLETHSKVISGLNFELSEILSQDLSLGLNITGCFSSILPREDNVDEY